MKKVVTAGLLSLGMVTVAQSQIIQSTQPELPVWGVTNNSGLAIAPFYHIHAMAFDDPGSSTYTIQWRDNGGTLWDTDTQSGRNPDVAYYANADALVVAYEDGGQVLVDDYYLATLSPIDYNLNANNGVASGENPNVDMNSLGNGVLTWQDGSDIYACTFSIGTFNPGPIVYIGNGENPDIALLDTDDEVIITYTNGGDLIIESYLHSDLLSGGATLLAQHIIPPNGAGHELPRVQSQRNSAFGPLDDFTVVDQEDLGGSQYLVYGFFFNGSGSYTPVKVNQGVVGCNTPNPRAVVAYERDQVHIAWAQNYNFGCSGINPVDIGRDILLGEFDFFGNNINGATVFLEVNNLNISFLNSATSLNTEYDGNYMINNSNYSEGIVFNDPGDAFWKQRDIGTPVFTPVMNDDPVSVVKAPASNSVEVTIETETYTETSTVEFVLYDNAGRLVPVNVTTHEGAEYKLDVTGLAEGTYLLHTTVDGVTSTERIIHFAGN